MKKNKISLKDVPFYLKALFSLGLVLFIVVLLPYLKHFGFSLSDSNDKWGQFGDYFGGILNPLLTFISFCALIYTIILQRKEIDENESTSDIKELVEIILIVDKEVVNAIQHYVKSETLTNKESNKSHPIYFDIEAKIVVIYQFIKRIENINPNSNYLDFFKIRYKSCVEKMHKANYFTKDINDYFVN